MNYPTIVVELVSAVLCFVLVRFMINPYRATGESRYLGLPVGFSLLGFSYIFMIAALYFKSFSLIEETTWLTIFMEAYAFAFIAATYFFSKKPADNSRLLWNGFYAVLIITALSLYLVLVEPPTYGSQDFGVANRDVLLFNIACIVYISIFTLRNHFLKPDPQTILVPFGYILLGFSQYSLLILSMGPNFVASVGANLLRILGLLIFVWVAYKSFHVSQKQPQEELANEEYTS